MAAFDSDAFDVNAFSDSAFFLTDAGTGGDIAPIAVIPNIRRRILFFSVLLAMFVAVPTSLVLYG